MDSRTSAGPKPNTVFMVAPNNGYPVFPGSMSQVPQYPFNQPQVHIISGNPRDLAIPVCTQPAQRSLREEKVLGAIQILIGLIHIALGIIMRTIIPGGYTAVSFYGGYPFWGGILFIISGSLSVASEQQPNHSCLLNGSLGLNTISAVCSMVGIVLFIIDMILNPIHPNHSLYWGVAPGVATSAVLFLFNLLELCVACTSAYFGGHVVCHSRNSGPVVFMANPMASPGPVNLPPSYSNVVLDSQ